MENSIYDRHTSAPSFDSSLNLLGDILTIRLRPEFRKIRVDGSNSGRVKICFTIFQGNDYTMRFFDTKNFRNFKGNSENREAEVTMFNSLVDHIIKTTLSDVVE